MGHRLMGHTGGCQNLHGHSYRAVVSLTGEPDSSGMVVDFADVKSVLAPFFGALDHAMLLHDSDTLVADFLRQNGLKVVSRPFHPTAEHIAAWIAEEAARAFRERTNVGAVKVQVIETATSTATVEVSW